MNHIIDTSFVPADLNGAAWAEIEPLFRDLLERPIDSPADLEKWLIDRSELEAALSEAMAVRYINMTCHSSDEQAKAAFLQFVEEIEPRTKPLLFELNRRYVASPHRAGLNRHRYEVFDRDTEVEVELFREENVPIETQLMKLDQQYQEICGEMTCEFDGEERTLAHMSRYVEETDRTRREAAWRAVADRRLRDADRIGAIYDDMIALRSRVARNAGFDNYRDYMFRKLKRFDYSPADCEAFHRACEEIVVPLMRRLNDSRAAALGVDPLRPWDLAVDTRGRAPLRPFETADQLVDGAARIFQRMDPGLGELFERLREPGSLDLESRKGKAPGGYHYPRDRSRKPFIFMNAAGLTRDVDTLLHEGGHAFHSMLCVTEPMVAYRHSPTEFAEVASMSMELTALPFVDEFYRGGDADRARRHQLETVVTTLPWIATIDAFQHWIYTNPDHTHDERRAQWIALNRRFGSSASWDGLERYLDRSWQRQLHLFGAPFYYIEYGIAQLGALQLWVWYGQDPSAAIEGYKRGLALGGSRPLPELFNAAGLAFDFGPDRVRPLIDEIERELERLPA